MRLVFWTSLQVKEKNKKMVAMCTKAYHDSEACYYRFEDNTDYYGKSYLKDTMCQGCKKMIAPKQGIKRVWYCNNCYECWDKIDRATKIHAFCDACKMEHNCTLTAAPRPKRAVHRMGSTP